MRIAVRTDASRPIGLGHVKRCLALAQALRDAGAEIRFVLRPSDVDGSGLVAAVGFPVLSLPSHSGDAEWSGENDKNPAPHAGWLVRRWDHDAADTIAALNGWRPHVVLVDHYGIEARWHRALREATGARIVVVDDLADRALAADLVIDHNPSPDHTAKYRSVLQVPAQVCGGARFALLDPVYRALPAATGSGLLTSIGIFVGGTDPGDHSSFAYHACRTDADWLGPIEIASTSANRSLAALQALASADPLLTVTVDQPDLAGFHARHELQVGAGGGALWERCCIGTPTLALITAPNQRLSVPLLAADGVVVGFDAVERNSGSGAALGLVIRRLIGAATERAAMRERSRALVDGHGAARAAAAVLALVERSREIGQ